MGNNHLHTEKELFQLIAEGDEAAFYTLYNRLRPMLRPFIYKFTKSPADAEDVMQEAFLKIWLSRDKLAEIDYLQAWIFKVTASVCVDYLRKQLGYQRRLNRYERTVPAKDETVTPLDVLQLGEIHQFINGVIEKMPPQRKHIFQLSRSEGKKPSEIAIILSVSVGTVKNTLTTAVKQIREALEAAGYPVSIIFFLILKKF